MERRCSNNCRVHLLGVQVASIAKYLTDTIAVGQASRTGLIAIDQRRNPDPFVASQDREVHLLGDGAATDHGHAHGSGLLPTGNLGDFSKGGYIHWTLSNN
jgi:hypothetical protein